MRVKTKALLIHAGMIYPLGSEIEMSEKVAQINEKRGKVIILDKTEELEPAESLPDLITEKKVKKK